MIKSFLMMLCMLTTLTVQAQSADERIGILMNESRWFELERELKNTPADSVNPFLHKMAAAITHHYFNRPDSACIVLGDLLNNHQKELGDNTFSMAMLMGMNLARTGRYTEAADLIQNLYDQLKTQGADSTQTDGLPILVRQYRAFADNAPVCRPLHPAGTYRIPMRTHNAMHEARNMTDNGHFITMDGHINGRESSLVFDTGAGVNIISSNQARDYGLRLLDAVTPMSGIGTQQGRYAMADTLRIGDMAWANVPFLIVDIQTGNQEADSIGTLLPPVIGLPVMLRMEKVLLDFEHRQFVIPAGAPHSMPGGSNLLRTDNEGLRIESADENGQPVYFHFDTGGYDTTLSPCWYNRHKDEVQAAGTADSLSVAGVGGVNITRSYRLPHKQFRIGNGTAVLDSVMVDTGIDLYTGDLKKAHYLTDEPDGTLGLSTLEHFRSVILDFKEMYIDAIPY